MRQLVLIVVSLVVLSGHATAPLPDSDYCRGTAKEMTENWEDALDELFSFKRMHLARSHFGAEVDDLFECLEAMRNRLLVLEGR